MGLVDRRDRVPAGADHDGVHGPPHGGVHASLGLALCGIPGVLLAAYIVKSMDLKTVRWLVIVVVVYTAVTMLRAGLSESEETVTD